MPVLDVGLVGVDVDGEVEEIRDEHRRRLLLTRPGLQHIQPFDDDDVRLMDRLILTGNDVVREVRVDRAR